MMLYSMPGIITVDLIPLIQIRVGSSSKSSSRRCENIIGLSSSRNGRSTTAPRVMDNGMNVHSVTFKDDGTCCPREFEDSLILRAIGERGPQIR